MPDRDEHYWKYRVFREPEPTDDSIGHPVPVKAEYLDSDHPNYEEWAELEEVEANFFVLRPEHDHHARVAMAAYAYSARREFPHLAGDIVQMIEELEWEEEHGDSGVTGVNPKAESLGENSGQSGNVFELTNRKPNGKR